MEVSRDLGLSGGLVGRACHAEMLVEQVAGRQVKVGPIIDTANLEFGLIDE